MRSVENTLRIINKHCKSRFADNCSAEITYVQ